MNLEKATERILNLTCGKCGGIGSAVGASPPLLRSGSSKMELEKANERILNLTCGKCGSIGGTAGASPPLLRSGSSKIQ